MRYPLRTLVIVSLSLISPIPANGQEKDDPSDAIYGEWQIEEMIYKGRVQDFGGQTAGWFRFEKGYFLSADESHTYLPKRSCTIRQNEIDIRDDLLGREKMLRALYDLKDGRLRIVWREDYGARPTNFDVLNDKRLTLYVLKKVK